MAGGAPSSISAAITACHSAGVTGVMDRRLPGLSSTIEASSGRVRMALSDSSGVVARCRTSTFCQRGLAGSDLASKYGLFLSNCDASS